MSKSKCPPYNPYWKPIGGFDYSLSFATIIDKVPKYLPFRNGPSIQITRLMCLEGFCRTHQQHKDIFKPTVCIGLNLCIDIWVVEL